MLRNGFWFFTALVLQIGMIAVFTAGSHGEDFQGAAKLMQKLQAPPAPDVITPVKGDSLAAFHKDTVAFGQTSSALPPTEAARQWLTLFDRAMALTGSNNRFSGYGMFSGPTRDLMSVLPGPDAWPDLQKRTLGQ